MKNQMKGKKGITLIALVITIIVLLILAGVTVATLAGDNGLLTKAGAAKNTSQDAEIEEQIRLAWNKAYMDNYLNDATDKANTMKTELEKNGYSVDDVKAQGNKIIITNYRGKNKEINISNGSINDSLPAVEYSTLNIGDYVNYPVYYNNVGTKFQYWSSNEVKGNYPRDNYTGWRILSIDTANDTVNIVSAGTPMNFRHYEYASTSVENLTTNFFNTPIENGMQKFYQCGFKESQNSDITISNMANVKTLFSNNLTQINGEIPNVRVMNYTELRNTRTTLGISNYKSSDLLAVPCKDESSGEYAVTVFSEAANQSRLYYLRSDGDYDYETAITGGVRVVVYLKSGIKFVESENKINNTTTYDIFE